MLSVYQREATLTLVLSSSLYINKTKPTTLDFKHREVTRGAYLWFAWTPPSLLVHLTQSWLPLQPSCRAENKCNKGGRGGEMRRWDKVNKHSQRNQNHSKQVQHPRHPPGPGEASLESDCTLLGYLSLWPLGRVISSWLIVLWSRETTAPASTYLPPKVYISMTTLQQARSPHVPPSHPPSIVWISCLVTSPKSQSQQH